MSHTNHRRAGKPPKRRRAIPEGEGRRDCLGMATHDRHWMLARSKGQRRFWRALRRNGRLPRFLAFYAPRIAATGAAAVPDPESPSPATMRQANKLGRSGLVRKWRLRHCKQA